MRAHGCTHSCYCMSGALVPSCLWAAMLWNLDWRKQFLVFASGSESNRSHRSVLTTEQVNPCKWFSALSCTQNQLVISVIAIVLVCFSFFKKQTGTEITPVLPVAFTKRSMLLVKSCSQSLYFWDLSTITVKYVFISAPNQLIWSFLFSLPLEGLIYILIYW